MQMTTYVNFRGQCEDAFKFYETTLGAKIGPVFRYAATPLADDVPADWRNKIMHGSLTIGSNVLMADDAVPGRYEQPQGFSLSLQMNDPSDAERVFDALAAEGRVVTPLGKTFWAARFGVVVDRFGIRWLINCDGSDAGDGMRDGDMDRLEEQFDEQFGGS
jgi:PhnB protein